MKFIVKRVAVTATNKICGDGMDKGADQENKLLLDNGIIPDVPPLPPGWSYDPRFNKIVPPQIPVIENRR